MQKGWLHIQLTYSPMYNLLSNIQSPNLEESPWQITDLHTIMSELAHFILEKKITTALELCVNGFYP